MEFYLIIKIISQMIIDHICFAVKDLNDGISYWKNVFGYEQMTEKVENTRQKVKVTFLRKKESLMIKLIEPLENNKSLINFESGCNSLLPLSHKEYLESLRVD